MTGTPYLFRSIQVTDTRVFNFPDSLIAKSNEGDAAEFDDYGSVKLKAERK